MGNPTSLPKSPAELLDSQVVIEKSGAKPQDLDAVPETELLDISANRTKATLANVGSLATRRPPTKKGKSECDSDQEDMEENNEGIPEIQGDNTSNNIGNNGVDGGDGGGLETWIKHDRRDSHSDTSSSMSQTSYDPSKPVFKDLSSEIPDSSVPSTETTDTLDATNSSKEPVTLVSSRPLSGDKINSEGFTVSLFPSKFKRIGSAENWGKKKNKMKSHPIRLISSHSLETFPASYEYDSEPSSSSSGVVLLSSRPLEPDNFISWNGNRTGAQPNISIEHSPASTASNRSPDSKSNRYSLKSNLSSNPSEDSTLNKRSNPTNVGSITDWSHDHVCHWLQTLEMTQYIPSFHEKQISGKDLLLLDGSKLKTLGVSSSSDRNVLKKKIKEMKTAADKERKQMEKERKAKEKEQKKLLKKK
uniref:SAM domain-containing protein n=1 Tax=Octopus bimaculoides TaxID=37653 RepID=A0A0L8G9R7_OCTBM